MLTCNCLSLRGGVGGGGERLAQCVVTVCNLVGFIAFFGIQHGAHRRTRFVNVRDDIMTSQPAYINI